MRVARSATSCPTGTTWSIGTVGGRRFERLMATNNFPEFTGRLCPAPCEGACVLGINSDPVTIKSIELAIVERAFEEGWIAPRPPVRRTGKRVAVVGSGPAGLAAADDLNQVGPRGHRLRARRPDRRAAALRDSGVQDGKARPRPAAVGPGTGRHRRSAPSVEVGADVPVSVLRQEFDAIVLAGGASDARDLDVPGRDLRGHSPRHGVPDSAEPPLRRRRHRGGPRHLGRRQARRDHRRRRHRRRLPRHRPSAGRASPSINSSSCRGRLTRARPGIRGRNGRTSSACPRRTKKAATGTIRSPPNGSRATPTVGSVRSTRVTVERVATAGAVRFERVAGSEVVLEADLVLHRDGLHRS